MLMLLVSIVSCDDDMNQRILPESEQEINTERSAFYAMTGILQLMQEVGDDYVLLGELRADLMDVTASSPQYMRDIAEFKADSTNALVNPKKYYAIINNCNNLISKIDTSLLINGTKVLQKEMKVAKTFRAWAYLQLMQNYGKVYYYSKPMLSVADQQNYLVVSDMTQLTDSLIADLKPFCPVDNTEETYPNYKTIGTFISTNLFLPVRFVLGEMYLLRSEYSKAANMYYQMIISGKLMVLSNRNSWNSNQTAYTSNWPKLFSDLTLSEQLSYIAYTNEYGNNTTLPTLAGSSVYYIAPSALAISNWESQTYSITNTITLPGDLRGRSGSYTSFTKLDELNDKVDFARIAKYDLSSTYTSLCRTSLVYLRYAEAINRMGKPNMAFTFLKYGLNKSNLEIYAPKEIKSAEAFLDFGQGTVNDDLFKNNYGIRGRGCGNVELNNSFKFPADVTDSVEWVEDQIVLELALETAYEGNRFNDLMRIAERRGKPDYLATKISAKFSDAQKAVIFNLLSDKKNWYLPEKK